MATKSRKTKRAGLRGLNGSAPRQPKKAWWEDLMSMMGVPVAIAAGLFAGKFLNDMIIGTAEKVSPGATTSGLAGTAINWTTTLLLGVGSLVGVVMIKNPQKSYLLSMLRYGLIGTSVYGLGKGLQDTIGQNVFAGMTPGMAGFKGLGLIPGAADPVYRRPLSGGMGRLGRLGNPMPTVEPINRYSI